MAHVVVIAVGADRPGIVAAVTGVLVGHGCNLEDTSMTILRGHFTMMLVVETPPGGDPAALRGALDAAAAAVDVALTVLPIDEGVAGPPAGDPWTVSVYGADRPGIVHGVASLLAGLGVNIGDLTTRVAGPPEHPVYAMVLEVTVPPAVDPADLERRLGELAGELGVECSLHPSDADIL
ncbi:MAG: glycine cleavage system protein R [Acidimicrobiia bacterium]